MDADGNNQRNLSNDSANDFLPAWSSDGKKSYSLNLNLFNLIIKHRDTAEIFLTFK